MKDYEKSLYDRVGSNIGWDFSGIFKRVKTVRKKWKFLNVVEGHLDKETVLLDLGTGGGEKLLQLAKHVKKAYGIDISRGMIKTANQNLAKSKLSHVKFKLASVEKLPFSKNQFDVVICKHAPFNVKELYRVLKPNGIFITQQVGEKDKKNIARIFGRGQFFGKKAGASMNKYLENLKKNKFKILKKDTDDTTQYFANMEDIIFLLKNTPIIPNFDIKKDQEYLKEIERKYKTKKGIKTNAFRYLIICKKL